MALIRKAEAKDWDRIRELCCLTGKSGKPIEPERFKFFGEQWIGPYQALRPHWTFVAELDDTVVGYLTGCPDTQEFEQEKFFKHTLPLIGGIARRKFKWDEHAKLFIKRTFGLSPTPESKFSNATQTRLEREFPAHLHVNVDEAFRGKRIGDQLFVLYFAELMAEKIPGVHIFCGDGPVKFYERTGFVKLETVEFKPGVSVHCFGKSLR